MAGKTVPPAPDPRPGRNPGYAEPQPRDRDDARQRPDPPPGRPPDDDDPPDDDPADDAAADHRPGR